MDRDRMNQAKTYNDPIVKIPAPLRADILKIEANYRERFPEIPGFKFHLYDALHADARELLWLLANPDNPGAWQMTVLDDPNEEITILVNWTREKGPTLYCEGLEEVKVTDPAWRSLQHAVNVVSTIVDAEKERAQAAQAQ